MLNFVAIFIGGGLGTILRFLTDLLCKNCFGYLFPFGTLIVNVLGSFILGFLVSFFTTKSAAYQPLKLFLTVGFCGGLTTFSTFSLDFIKLLNENIEKALIYLALSLSLSFISVALGVYSCAK